jgi:hypothetical protein
MALDLSDQVNIGRIFLKVQIFGSYILRQAWTGIIFSLLTMESWYIGKKFKRFCGGLFPYFSF